MKIKKKRLTIVIIIILVIIVSIITIKKINRPTSYVWIKDENSVINQQRLYVVNRFKKHIKGYVRITYKNGKSEKVLIDKKGKLYVKSVVKKVNVINKR